MFPPGSTWVSMSQMSSKVMRSTFGGLFAARDPPEVSFETQVAEVGGAA